MRLAGLHRTPPNMPANGLERPISGYPLHFPECLQNDKPRLAYPPFARTLLLDAL